MFSQVESKVKVEMLASDVEVQLEQMSAQQTKVRVTLRFLPRIDHGMQKWDKKLRRRCRTEWLSLGDAPVGSAVLPTAAREALLSAMTHEVTLQHTLEKVQLELSKALLTAPPETKSKRPLSWYNQLQKQLAQANKRARQEKLVGSNGEKYDGCGTEEDLEDGFVCDRCKYTCCGSCASDHCFGRCFCKRG
ncbi:unnamed protein product [Polarella glacialis]|uniref:Uncharacterized protein n=1 Tax=Polarella glacialis TaxID=89957 RepID=A0A813IH85_POLGL|nr:unnamed protein product [Polarella glacialis]